MIKLLNHQEPHIAEEILAVSLASYQVEAKVIGASRFPPLDETVDDIMESDNLFYAYMDDERIAGVMEMEREDSGWTMARIVVLPAFFRRGIGSSLVAYGAENYQPCRVSTAVNNLPAIALYEKHGFIKSPITRAVTPEITIVSLELRSE